mmetsp:Transcript_4859/g.7308  ORF Transcript_4859/g.7308 Transcript_4859/m.7308 type:complete len:133 (+) Transcript_4859:1386-1784(+)
MAQRQPESLRKSKEPLGKTLDLERGRPPQSHVMSPTFSLVSYKPQSQFILGNMAGIDSKRPNLQNTSHPVSYNQTQNLNHLLAQCVNSPNYQQMLNFPQSSHQFGPISEEFESTREGMLAGTQHRLLKTKEL